MRLKKALAFVSCLAIACTGLTFLRPGRTVRAQYDPDNGTDSAVPLNSTYFKDPNFLEKMKTFDYDGSGTLSETEIRVITRIDVHDSEIYSLEGIQWLTDLFVLDCSGNYLSKLNLSGNPRLVELHCEDNIISSLDLTKNPNLERLYCYGNTIKKLDLTPCSKLSAFMGSGTDRLIYEDGPYRHFLMQDGDLALAYDLNITVTPDYQPPLPKDDSVWIIFPDLSFTAYALTIDIDMNQNGWLDQSEIERITQIDVTNMAIQTLEGIEVFRNLEMLECANNYLVDPLDVSGFPKLKYLVASNSRITELDLSANPELILVDVSNNHMKSLKLGNQPNLALLMTHGNDLGALDISSCPILLDTVKNYPQEIGNDGTEYYYHMYSDAVNVFYLSYDKNITPTLVPEPVTPDPNPGTPDPSNPNPGTPDPATPAPSDEPLFAQFINRLYKYALCREPEADGKAFWLNKVLNEGFSGGRCAYGFLIEAQEFLNRDLTNEQFIDTLYLIFFDRAPDEAGKAFWLSKFAEGMTRAQMVNGFIDSTEWCNLCAYYGVKSGAPNARAEKPSENATKFATRLYTECLNRDPDTIGLSFWALRLTNLECSGADAAYDFFHSAEFLSQSIDDTQYVIRLYHTFMGRDADADGLAFWVRHLATDMTRDQVLKGFAESQEFTNICNMYGIDRGTL